MESILCLSWFGGILVLHNDFFPELAYGIFIFLLMYDQVRYILFIGQVYQIKKVKVKIDLNHFDL